MEISIHALREEGDPEPCLIDRLAENFYPRPPRVGRPGGKLLFFSDFSISIHALREEGDLIAKFPL